MQQSEYHRALFYHKSDSFEAYHKRTPKPWVTGLDNSLPRTMKAHESLKKATRCDLDKLQTTDKINIQNLWKVDRVVVTSEFQVAKLALINGNDLERQRLRSKKIVHPFHLSNLMC